MKNTEIGKTRSLPINLHLSFSHYLIDCMVFKAIQHNFSCLAVASTTLHAFLDRPTLLPVLHTIFFLSHGLISSYNQSSLKKLSAVREDLNGG